MLMGLLDYGAGNLTSVRKAFDAAGAQLTVVNASHLPDCAGIVVPGVGHFAATRAIGSAVREAVTRRVEAGVPLLGICLGMQWLFAGSAESPDLAGLGIFEGRCERMTVDRPLKVPHVGWNRLRIDRSTPLLEGVESDSQVYFTHSFAAPVTGDCVASTTHGKAFAAAVERGQVCGVQFHPEKSGEVGLAIIRNFIRMTRG